MEHHSEGSVSSNTDYMRMKRSNRHTPRQIQRLEALHLSRELALSPRQIDVWFQNKRAHMKTREERDDNSKFIEENDKIRSENIAMREALKNGICSTCGGPPINVDCDFDEQKLRIENALLREELLRVSSIAARFNGRSISHLQFVTWDETRKTKGKFYCDEMARAHCGGI